MLRTSAMCRFIAEVADGRSGVRALSRQRALCDRLPYWGGGLDAFAAPYPGHKDQVMRSLYGSIYIRFTGDSAGRRPTMYIPAIGEFRSAA
jgi:hypothetical protein